jgi:hypothetical protein
VDAKVDSLHVKRIGIEDLVGYVYIVRVDLMLIIWESKCRCISVYHFTTV